jgi:hypothetical protein
MILAVRARIMHPSPADCEEAVVGVLIVAITAAVVVVRNEGVLGALLFGALVRTTRRKAVVVGAFISRGPCQEY